MLYSLLFSLFAAVSATAPVLWGKIDVRDCTLAETECNWYKTQAEATKDQKKRKYENKNLVRLTLEDDKTWQCYSKMFMTPDCARYADDPSYLLNSTGNTNKGSDIVLLCRSNEQCVWLHDNSTITTANKLQRHQFVDDRDFNCSLMITNVQTSDSGRWHCDGGGVTLKVHELENDTDSKLPSKVDEVKLMTANESVAANDSLTAVYGSTAIIPCRSPTFNESKKLSSSSSYYTQNPDRFDSLCFWIHEDTTAIFSHRSYDVSGYQILFYGSKYEQCDLLIYKVTEEHQGDWYCKRGANPRQKFQLNVIDRVGSFPPDVSAVQGSAVILPCRLRSNNKLCFWTHGTDLVLSKSNQNSIGYSIISDPDKGNCNLLIQNVKRKDRGNWYCHNIGFKPIRLELGVVN